MERITVLERGTYTPLFDWCVGRWKEDARQARDASALVQFFYQFARDVQGGNVIRIEFSRPADLDRVQRSSFPRASYGIQPWTRGAQATAMMRKRSTGSTPGQQGTQTTGAQPAQNGNQPHTNLSLSPPTSPLALQPTSPVGSPNAASSSSSPLTQQKNIEMFCSDNEQIIVAIFVNSDYDKPGSSISLLLRDSFLSSFSSILEREHIGLENKPQQSMLGGSQTGGAGGHSRIGNHQHEEEGGVNESFLPMFASFKETVEKSGVLKIEPKKNVASTPGSTGVGASLHPSGSPSTRSSYAERAQVGGRGSAGSHSPPQVKASSLPNHQSSPITRASGLVIGSVPAGLGSGHEDYMPSWLSEGAEHSGGGFVLGGGMGHQLLQQHPSNNGEDGTVTTSVAHSDSARKDTGGDREAAPLLQQHSSISHIPARPSMAAEKDLPSPHSATSLDEVQITLR